MKKKSLLLCGLILMVLISGCKKKVQEKKIYLVGKNVNQTEISESIEKEPEQSDYREMTIGFINELSADLGMISIIDPVTDEQVNIDGIADGEMLTVGSVMPKDVTEIEWAVYNKNGELYSSSATDISTANESVFIIMSGNGSIEDIKVIFDKKEEDVRQALKNEK